MKTTLLFALIFLVLSVNAYEVRTATETEVLLCGERPQGEVEEQKLILERRRLENAMPPVADQNPASWCVGFSVADLINFHNLQQAYTQSPRNFSTKAFYAKDQSLISPIDIAGASTEHVQKNAMDQTGLRCQINVDNVVWAEAALIELQARNYKARSRAVLGFESKDDGTPESRAKLQSLIAQFKQDYAKPLNNTYYNFKGEKCPAEMYESPKYSDILLGFEFINSKLYCAASDKKCLVSPKSISDYDKVTEDIPMDLSIKRFSIGSYYGTDTNEYLRHLGKNVNSRPVMLHICAEDINSKATAQGNESGCGHHAVLAVGAYFKGGQCIVRIRNSWGQQFGNNGYVDMSISTLIATNKKSAAHSKSRGFNERRSLIWLNAPLENTKEVMTYFSDTDKFIGTIDLLFLNLTVGPYINLKSGYKTDKNGKVIEMIDCPTSEKGTYYTGSITEHADKTLAWGTGTIKNEAGQVIANYVNGIKVK